MSKHILIPCQYFYPEQFRINDIAFEWVKRGYRVTVVTGIPNYPEGKFFDGYGWFKNRKETINGVEVIRLPIIPRGNSKIGLIANYFSYPIVGFFWNIFTKQKADAVFMFETSPMNQLKVGVSYAKKHHVPAFSYIQDLWPENVQSVGKINTPIVINSIVRMVEKIYAGCTEIFTTSPSFVGAIQKHLPKEQHEKVHFWPQYAEKFYQPKEKVEHDDFRVIFTGNVGKAQGLEILPQAARLYKDKTNSLEHECRNLKFVIVGDGRGREDLEASIKSLGVEDMFEFTGRKPAAQIPGILATADVAFVSFANDEIFAMTIPAKLQSYMACEMPIIASAIGETERVIKEADCGFCSNIGDAKALEENIEHMIELSNTSPEILKTMGKNAYDYNLEHFSKEKLLDEMDRYFSMHIK